MTSYNHRAVNRFVGWKYDWTKGTVNWEKRKTESFFLLTLIFLKQFLFKKILWKIQGLWWEEKEVYDLERYLFTLDWCPFILKLSLPLPLSPRFLSLSHRYLFSLKHFCFVILWYFRPLYKKKSYIFEKQSNNVCVYF